LNYARSHSNSSQNSTAKLPVQPNERAPRRRAALSVLFDFVVVEVVAVKIGDRHLAFADVNRSRFALRGR